MWRTNRYFKIWCWFSVLSLGFRLKGLGVSEISISSVFSGLSFLSLVDTFSGYSRIFSSGFIRHLSHIDNGNSII